MHELIPIKIKIVVLVVLILFFFLVFAFISKAANQSTELFSPGVFISSIGWIVSGLGLLSFILGFEKPWTLVARPWLLGLFGVPSMGGVWKGTVRSNYSRLDALRLAARDGDIERQDADEPNFVDNHPLLAREASLQIVVSLWRIKVVLNTGPAGDRHLGVRSESVVSRAVRTPEGVIEVWYVYRAVNHDEPAGNDGRDHLGAAILTFGENACTGVYWTERNWSKGMNTAGRLSFSR